MRYLFSWALIALFVLLLLPAMAEARCGGRGGFRNRQHHPVRSVLHRLRHPL